MLLLEVHRQGGNFRVAVAHGVVANREDYFAQWRWPMSRCSSEMSNVSRAIRRLESDGTRGLSG